ncbi:MAG: leishmanolysin-related zinc metalloendopeptidase [Gemmatimonadaceae bacterium]|nr:leishmanolysin-related zinc metalloendopeptidase [Gemmatimonadaceae bacterium]
MTRAFTPPRAVRFSSLVATFLFAACGGGEGGTSPQKPAAVQSASGAGASATVGTALTSAPTFTVTDASGNALGNVAVSVAVTSGGGTLVGAPTKSAGGPTSVGTWTLGTTAGTNTLTVTVSGLTPLIISVTGTAGGATKIVVTGGNSQTGLAGAQLGTPLSASVQDQFGNGIPNQQVTFLATAGGGSVSPAQVTTNASGVATGAVWRLGNRGGPQAVSATAGTFSTSFSATIQTSYVLDLRYFGPAMSTEAQTAFVNAANRIKAAIVGQISTVSLQGADLAGCGISGLTGVLAENTQGLIIYASVAPIDGVGKILAQAGPCFVRQSSILPAVGVMQFDEADIQNYINSGRFESVVLHEMNHVVGFGTIWVDKAVLLNAVYTNTENPTPTGSTDPRFGGAAGLAQCLAAGGSATHCTSGVAVEQCGTAGTADGHWRETFTTTCTGTNNSPVGGTPAFDNEMMTGYVEGSANMPWSAMSIASFQDIGYSVNLLAADSYNVPNLLTMARLRAAREAEALDRPVERILRPRFTIGGGRVQAIRRGHQ